MKDWCVRQSHQMLCTVSVCEFHTCALFEHIIQAQTVAIIPYTAALLFRSRHFSLCCTCWLVAKCHLLSCVWNGWFFCRECTGLFQSVTLEMKEQQCQHMQLKTSSLLSLFSKREKIFPPLFFFFHIEWLNFTLHWHIWGDAPWNQSNSGIWEEQYLETSWDMWPYYFPHLWTDYTIMWQSQRWNSAMVCSLLW